jgi:methionine synthase I (cobalamin-dependent)
MPVALGGTAVARIRRGTTEIVRAYKGAALIFEATGAPPAADVILLENGTDALLLETSDPAELDTAIPAQSEAAALDGSEWTVIVQDGTTKKVRTALLAGYLNG